MSSDSIDYILESLDSLKNRDLIKEGWDGLKRSHEIRLALLRGQEIPTEKIVALIRDLAAITVDLARQEGKHKYSRIPHNLVFGLQQEIWLLSKRALAGNSISGV